MRGDEEYMDDELFFVLDGDGLETKRELGFANELRRSVATRTMSIELPPSRLNQVASHKKTR